jgi:hypothetical protein
MSGLTYNHVDVHQGWDEGSRRSSIESLLSYARECEDDGKLPGIWSGDCLFVLEPDPGPDVPVESGDAISSSAERRNRFLRRRNRPRERPHINPAASIMSHQGSFDFRICRTFFPSCLCTWFVVVAALWRQTSKLPPPPMAMRLCVMASLVRPFKFSRVVSAACSAGSCRDSIPRHPTHPYRF